ncbi:hypothetical protein [Virgisporangium aurantiacum]|uniref:Uncharacterized protein n=1 Tax=Virgisporangium aurantiacum TaxID=175570 RepID=A0A8J3Z8B3_9ACTN|nr:hypothetical protein [Virgisporangium aurantiacum]GIJ56753.1 hypothetical protein Vau01_042690 [Virgisporangium aurantiacum]
MFDLSAMTIASNAVTDHVLSARPDAPTVRERPPRARGDAVRRLTVSALRRIADRLEPGHPTYSAAHHARFGLD